MPAKKLTAQQEAFCQAYVKANGRRGAASNAYRAAYRANMSADAVASNAKKLLRSTPIRLRIGELKAQGVGGGEGLTPKQDAFARFYMELGNASEAYRRAYDVAATTKPQTVHVKASELLAHAKVAVRIAELRAAVEERHGVTIDMVMREHKKIGFSNILDYISIGSDGRPYADFSRLTREQAAAIGEIIEETVLSSDPDAQDAAGVEAGESGKKPRVAVIKTRLKLHNKQASLVEMGKHLGMYEADNRQKAEAEAAVHAAAAERSNDDLARRLALILAMGARKAAAARTGPAMTGNPG